MEEPLYEFEINTFTGQWSIRRPSHSFNSTPTSKKRKTYKTKISNNENSFFANKTFNIRLKQKKKRTHKKEY